MPSRRYTDAYIARHPDEFPFAGMDSEGIATWLARPLAVLGNQDGTSDLVPMSEGEGDRLTKATLTSADAAAFNALFGPATFVQYLRQKNAAGAIGREGYRKFGYRAVKTASITGNTGIAEGGAVPTPVEPVYYEIGVGLKEEAVATEMSSRLEIYSGKDDTITFNGNAQEVLEDFLAAYDTDLLRDFNTLAVNNPESLDRVTATTQARIDLGYTDGDEDLHGVDRSAESWYDSLNLNNGGAVRPLTQDLWDDLAANLISRWGDDIGEKIYITDPLTHKRLGNILGSGTRYASETVANRIAGVTPVPGQAGGYKCAVYEGRPIVMDDNVVQDSGGIGRAYLVDQKTLKQVLGREFGGLVGDNFVYLNAFVHRIVYYGVAELTSWYPRASGQLRDLS